MYLYHKKCHKTHLLLIEENDKLINEYHNINLSQLYKIQERLKIKKQKNEMILEKPTFGIAVDGWCSGNPGPGGYKGVDLQTGEVLFLQNHLGRCTNNIAEFIAIVHGLQYIKKHGKHNAVYTDSEIAIAWTNMKSCGTKFDTTCNPELVQKIWRCEMWLLEQKKVLPFRKWDTKNWGEIPADFGNK